MSFILDALRKADQMRQDTPAPTLTTLQAAAPTPSRPTLRPIVAGCALLGIGLLIGWWQPWATSPPPLQTAPVALLSPLEPLEPLKPLPHAPIADEQALVAMTLPPAPAAPPSQTLTRTTAAATPTSQIPQAPAPPISPTSPTPADRPPITLSEIPRNLLAELPRLTISAHAYSDKPGAGFVYLSDHLLHEGDTLPVGLKLEQITPDGAILSYKGYRFRLGLQP